MTPEEQKELYKQAIKEAAEEWLKEQYSTFGRWTMRGLLSAVSVVILYMYASAHGWVIKL